MFPICETDSDFKENAARRIKRLPIEAQKLIEQVQPYDRDGLLPLSTINKLDVIDKHKLLPVAYR
jgi:hypothetical protein